MRKINFLFKTGIAFFLLGFALWYQNLIYNVILILIFSGVLHKERITLFRFAKQKYYFMILLATIFIFQALNGYGKILLQLPFGLTVTDQGVNTAALYIFQLLMIFLLFGSVIYSTDRQEILFYFGRLKNSDSKFGRAGYRAGRIGMYVFYLLPKSVGIQREVSGSIKNGLNGAALKFKEKSGYILSKVYLFFYRILKGAEDEYGDFVAQDAANINYSPGPVLSVQNVLLLTIIAITHGYLLWR